MLKVKVYQRTKQKDWFQRYMDFWHGRVLAGCAFVIVAMQCVLEADETESTIWAVILTVSAFGWIMFTFKVLRRGIW